MALVPMRDRTFDPEALRAFDERVLEAERSRYRDGNESLRGVVAALLTSASGALADRRYSVMDKSTLPPSGQRNDYWHPAPYYWPNPATGDGLPYVRRDGERVDGTEMYSRTSARYDRTRIQLLFDNTTILMLAWYFTGDPRYAARAASNIDCWFVDPATAMTPHLRYAQVRPGWEDAGRGSGIIETKDFYFFLDAVRLARRASALSHESSVEVTRWCATFLEWLLMSPQGRRESERVNNHGTNYDLQVASIAAFVGAEAVVHDVLGRCRRRISEQITPDGQQPAELSRTRTFHYCTFNLQAWCNLAVVARRDGVDLWDADTDEGRRLSKALAHMVSFLDRPWPHREIGEIDRARLLPLWHTGALRCPGGMARIATCRYAARPVFHPHDGIRPFWCLGFS
jgi:hypothetical protein